MATLGKIREKSTLLVTILAIALALFVLQGLLESRGSFFASDRNVVGIIGGKKIKIEEYQAKVDEEVENEKQRSGRNPDENTTDMIRQQVWNQILFQEVMQDEYQALGVDVSTDELFDMVQGPDPDPSVKQAFTDPQTGQFNRANVINFLKNMDQDQTGDTRRRWVAFETAIKGNRVTMKYNNLVKKGLYVTKSQALNDWEANNHTAKYKYVLKRFDSVSDSSIQVTDEDLKRAYNENKNLFRQPEDSRSLEYVIFEVKPSEEDKKATFEYLSGLKNDFATATDDSSFVAANSDIPYMTNSYKKGTFPAAVDTVLFSSPVGTVVGPYEEADAYKLAKLTKEEYLPDSVKARHILIKIAGADTAKALAKADSLKKLIKSGKKFDELAKTNSEDVGSAEKGGDLGWFKEGTMVKPFSDAVFYGKKGDLPIVTSQFGVHLIEVLDKGPETKRVRVAVVEKKNAPSSQTFQQVYAQASEFAGKNNTAEAFKKTVTEKGLNRRVADNVREIDRNLPGVENSRELIRWAYTAENNDVSQVFELGDKYVVAMVTSVKEKGYRPMEDVKDMLTDMARKEVKAQKFMAEMTGSTIDQVATAAKTQVVPVDMQNFASATIPGQGREPAVVGHVFGLKAGALSKPIKGELGVYVVQVESFNTPAAPADLSASKNQLVNSMRSRVDYEMFEALKEKAEVEDYRGKFY